MKANRTVNCDYCGAPALLVRGSVIYPKRSDLHNLFFWQCPPCNAYVGCHKSGSGVGTGTVPLGRLANAELRRAKKLAHHYFDRLWRDKIMTRSKAYAWLARTLDIPAAEAHIGMMDVARCQRTADAAKNYGYSVPNEY